MKDINITITDAENAIKRILTGSFEETEEIIRQAPTNKGRFNLFDIYLICQAVISGNGKLPFDYSEIQDFVDFQTDNPDNKKILRYSEGLGKKMFHTLLDNFIARKLKPNEYLSILSTIVEYLTEKIEIFENLYESVGCPIETRIHMRDELK